MTQVHNVAVLVGSLRKDSGTRKLAKAFAELAPANLKFNFVEIGDLPHYDSDLETDTPPAAWTRFRDEVGAAEAILFVTPEYNRSFPGFLKNAIDVGSRPWGKAVWNEKPVAIISTSAGALGGFGANHALRQAISFFNMPLLGQPEAFIGNVLSLFDESGALTSDSTEEFLRNLGVAFAAHVERNVAATAVPKAA